MYIITGTVIMEIVLNQFMACNIQAVNCSLQVKTL